MALGGECTLELIAIKKGSTVLEFGLVNPTPVGADVVCEIVCALASIANGEERQIDAGVLQGVYEFASIVPSERISEIGWIYPGTGGRKRIVACFNGAVRERIGARLSGNFFAGSSIAELAAAQKVSPQSDVSALAGGFPVEEDVDEFLEDIYSARK